MNSETVVSGRPPLAGYKTDITSGLALPAWDYMSLAQASTTDTYTFKTGGSGGSTVATVTVTFTDSSKAVISNVVKT